MARKGVRPKRLRFDKPREARLTHYLFRYPAKFHPPVAAALLKKFSRPGQTILDPFCGSATLLVEASVLGRNGIGLDIDPVATFIAAVKTRRISGPALQKSASSLINKIETIRRPVESYQHLQFHDITERSLKTQITRQKLTIPSIPNIMHWFRKYVIVDLAKLHSTILRLRAPKAHKRFFLACFCSIIRNVSNADPVPVSGLEVTAHMKAKDKNGRVIDPFTIFIATLNRSLADHRQFKHATKSSTSKIRIVSGDATIVRKHIRRRVHTVITSPPYHNAVDYYRRHTLEMYWLGLVDNPEQRLALLPKYIGRTHVPQAHPFITHNILKSQFARRCERMMRSHDKSAADAFKHYAIAMKKCFLGLAGTLHPNGTAVFVLGKSSWNGRKLPTTRLFEELAAPHFRLTSHYWYPLKNRYMTYTRRNGANIDREHVLVFKLRALRNSSGSKKTK